MLTLSGRSDTARYCPLSVRHINDGGAATPPVLRSRRPGHTVRTFSSRPQHGPVRGALSRAPRHDCAHGAGVARVARAAPGGGGRRSRLRALRREQLRDEHAALAAPDRARDLLVARREEQPARGGQSLRPERAAECRRRCEELPVHVGSAAAVLLSLRPVHERAEDRRAAHAIPDGAERAARFGAGGSEDAAVRRAERSPRRLLPDVLPGFARGGADPAAHGAPRGTRRARRDLRHSPHRSRHSRRRRSAWSRSMRLLPPSLTKGVEQRQPVRGEGVRRSPARLRIALHHGHDVRGLQLALGRRDQVEIDRTGVDPSRRWPRGC